MIARPGFTICVCPDSTLIGAYVAGQLDACPPPGGSSWERHSFWGDEALPPIFWEHLTLQGLFNTPKALVVHNAQNIPADTWKKLSSALASPLGDTWLFLYLTVDFEKGAPKIPAHIAKLPCVNFARTQGWLWSSPGLDLRTRTKFIQQEARRLGLSFAPGALELVAKKLPADAAAIRLEMDKIALSLDVEPVITAQAAELLEQDVEADIFSLIRLLQSSNPPGSPNSPNPAVAVWQQVLGNRGADSMTFAFLSMLSREARQLWQLLAGESVFLPAQVMAAKQQLARGLGFAGIATLWQLALEADKGIKTGERDVDQAMEALVAGLFTLFSPPE